MCIVVAVAGARAPSSTPFFAAGAAAAVAAAAGAVVEVARRRLPLKGAAHAAIVLGVAFITIIPAGAVKYTYGSTGSLAISLTASPAVVSWGSTSALVGEVAVYNDGGTTVRVLPSFSLRVSDPGGLARPQFRQGCAVPQVLPPSERDLVEVPPGELLRYPFSIPLAWEGQTGPETQCGSLIIGERGGHLVSATFDSHSFGGFALVPIWVNTLTSQPAALSVQ
jgi:hypothetical protein